MNYLCQVRGSSPHVLYQLFPILNFLMKIVGHVCEFGGGFCEGLLEVEDMADSFRDSQVHGREFVNEDFEALTPDLLLG